MTFYGYHGADPAETKLGQRFIVDLDVWADLSRAMNSDELVDTINYSRLYRTTQKIVEGTSHKLLESVASAILEEVFATSVAIRARVAIRKPGVAIKGSILTAAGVEIVRDRPDL